MGRTRDEQELKKKPGRDGRTMFIEVGRVDENKDGKELKWTPGRKMGGISMWDVKSTDLE